MTNRSLIKNPIERLITATRNNTNNTRINRTTKPRNQKWEEKQLYRYFKRQISEISQGKTCIWLRKGDHKTETESLRVVAQNKQIRTNYVKIKRDKTQQNSRCWSCGDGDVTINHIISEFCKLTQKTYKTRHGWVGKVIHWKLCKKFRFYHMNNWYVHNSESVLKNETHKVLWDFEIQTDHRISARRLDVVIVKKERETAE